MKTISYADVLRVLEILGIDEQDAKNVRSVHMTHDRVLIYRLGELDGKNLLDGDRLMLTEQDIRIAYLDLAGQKN